MPTHDTFPLELDAVTCVFGTGARQVTALDSVSLALAPGELIAVMGPSGSGKSTLLNVAGLLQKPTSGRVLIDGADAADMSAKKTAELRRRHVGFVFQNFNLVSTLTVAENVTLPLELDGMSPGECAELADAPWRRLASRAAARATPRRSREDKRSASPSPARSSARAPSCSRMSPPAPSTPPRATRS